ncbi:VCBS repeat-containing protein [Streptomyces venezuelae]|uniref:FG-GAP-like repeat-containing protein n=1 Tax=Streptomyces venezuelae TaxID=54571 RepID=UPI001238A28A|nr:FG-GAP-like repeat-containing protein [Streptomyces venezuelae]QES06517.1 VCBS repeat-containing protein [Streptomyces venezuelae]
MHVTRTRGRRLSAAAVTLALAATGGTLTALPATAAVAASGATQEAGQTTVPFPRDADVVGAGPSGFLTKTRGASPEFRWTWYADGSSIVLPGASAVGGGSDLVVTGDREQLGTSVNLQVHDLSTPATAAAPTAAFNVRELGPYRFAGLAGATLLLERQEDGVWKQYAATIENSAPKLRWLLGSAQFTCFSGEEAWTSTDSALYDCWVGERGEMPAKVVVDLAGGSQPMYLQEPFEFAGQGAISATHVAWRESRMSGKGIIAHQRGANVERWFPADDLDDPLYLVGGWLAYGQKAHIDAPGGASASPTVRPFTLQSIKTGEKSVALTAFSSAVAGPGGSLLVRGGTPEHGEGLYRISPRADGGRPDVELVASTGQTTVVRLTGSDTPKTLSAEQLAGGADFGWDLSRGDAAVRVTLKHLRSGKTLTREWPADTADGAPRRVTWHWDGKDVERPDGLLSPARAGEYEWEITARPEEGIGQDLVTTGRFTVNRPQAPHDVDGDGTADLFARDSGGALWSLRTQPAAVGGSVTSTGRTRVGGGWQTYDRIESAGNIAGSSAPDVLARDTTGVLWLYQGTGDRAVPLSGRTRIGGGWQTFDRIAAGSDVTGDGRPDLLATDKTGVLWLYPGTGNATNPFSARKAMGGGWGTYNELTALGDFAGGPAGDLLARDKAGVLWLYLGKGDGTFAARTRVGGGWGGFTSLVGVGDANGDGHADLMATSGTGTTFYAGTGDWKAPLKPGAKTDVTNGAGYDATF